MIDTIHVENGFRAREVLKKIVAKGWDKFFVKPAYMSFFGAGVINGTLLISAGNIVATPENDAKLLASGFVRLKPRFLWREQM